MAGNDPKTKIIITAQDEASDVFDGLKTRLTGVAAAIGGAFAADKLIDFVTEMAPVADAAANLEARIKLAVGEMGNLDGAMEAVRNSANAVGTDINAVGGLFAGLTSSTKDLGKSQDDVAKLTDTINKSFAVSGTSASAAAGAITQLGQAFASGALRGDEFNSVNEAAPRLMQALADGLGVARGELRAMAEQGKLTSEVIFNALQSQSAVIDAEFGKLPDTIGRATQRLSNEWQVFIGQLNESTGASEIVAGGLNTIAENLDGIASAAEKAGEVVVAVLAVKAAAALRGYTAQMTLSTAATTAQAVALNGLAAAGRAATGALLTLGRALPALAVAGVVAGVAALVVEFFRAKSAAEEGEEAVRKMLEDTPTNNAAKEIRLVATEAEAARFKLSDMERAFGEMRTKGQDAAAALESVVKAANLTSVDGIAAVVTGLDQLRVGAQVTGEQIEVALAARLRRMSAEDLRDFGIQAEMAFNRGALSAQQLAVALDSQARAALQRLGVDADAALTGMSAKFTEASGALGVVVGQFDRLAAAGVNAGEVLQQAVTSAIKAAANPVELQTLAETVAQLGKEGKLAGSAVTAALDAIRRKADEATPGINSVTEAFKELGIVTDATLQEAANKAKSAFDKITASGSASTRELAAAYKAYAERAIAANGGVANAAMQAQAAQYGLKIEADATGKSIVRSMSEAAQATEKVGDAATESAGGGFRALSSSAAQSGQSVSSSMHTAASATDKVAEAADRAAQSFWGMSEAARQAETDAERLSRWEQEGKDARQTRSVSAGDPFPEALRRGLIDDPMVGLEFRDAFNAFFAEAMAKMNAGSALSMTAQTNAASQLAMERAAEFVKNQKAEEDKSGVRTNRYEVRLRLGGLSRTVNVASASDAQNLTDFLQQLENEAMRAS